MDKSARRILFCNFCQNNTGNLSTSTLANAVGLISVLPTLPIKQFDKPAPGSNSHWANTQSQFQFFPLPTLPAKILIPVLLSAFLLAAIIFSPYSPSKAEHLINQSQPLTSTVSKGILSTALCSDDLTCHVFANIQLSKIQLSKNLAANLLMNLVLYAPVPESNKLKKMPTWYFILFFGDNFASISLPTDHQDRLL